MTDEEIITIYEKNRGLIITALRATGLMGFNTNTPQSQELISVGKMCFLQALYRYSARQPKVSLATYLYKSVKWGACRYMRRHQALMRSGPIAKSGTHKYLLSLDASASNDFEVGLLVDLIADDNTPLPCDNVASDYDMLFDQLHKCAAELPPRQRAVIESIINNDDCPCGPNLKGSHLQHIRRSSRPAVKKIKQLLMEYRNAKLTA